MESSRAAEHLLGSRDGSQRGVNSVDAEAMGSRQRPQACGHVGDGGAAADPAGGADVAESRRGHRCPAASLHGDHVVLELGCWAFAAVAHARQRCVAEQPVTRAETRRQLVVVPRRAHGGGHHVPVEADLEGLLHHDFVGRAPPFALPQPVHQHPHRAPPPHPVRVPAPPASLSPTVDRTRGGPGGGPGPLVGLGCSWSCEGSR